jgi:hypothetical protein
MKRRKAGNLPVGALADDAPGMKGRRMRVKKRSLLDPGQRRLLELVCLERGLEKEKNKIE